MTHRHPPLAAPTRSTSERWHPSSVGRWPTKPTFFCRALTFGRNSNPPLHAWIVVPGRDETLCPFQTDVVDVFHVSVSPSGTSRQSAARGHSSWMLDHVAWPSSWLGLAESKLITLPSFVASLPLKIRLLSSFKGQNPIPRSMDGSCTRPPTHYLFSKGGRQRRTE